MHRLIPRSIFLWRLGFAIIKGQYMFNRELLIVDKFILKVPRQSSTLAFFLIYIFLKLQYA